jgi:UDP-N-acetylmuramyl pentapeptide phosphotransferase/UDP-N-acetylglucosamine-1-phosphate transferase
MLLLGGFLAGWALTGIVTSRLRVRSILDRPGARSSHTKPTPRGGGWGFIVPAMLALAVLLWLQPSPVLLAVGGGSAVLALVSWWDDLRNAAGRHVPILVRLAVHVFAVAWPLAFLSPAVSLIDHALPLWVERAALALVWLWLINLFNFMDGIDTLAAGEAAAVLFGFLILGLIVFIGSRSIALSPIVLAAVLLGALGGFLRWNWPPAQVFMGDVGSVFLGYVLGFILLQLAIAGAWAAALILPLAFIGDATATLLRRLLRGEKIWQAHRSHAYQRAVARGESPGAVSAKFAVLNLGLIALAVTSLLYPWPSVAAAAVIVLAFLARLGRGAA